MVTTMSTADGFDCFDLKYALKEERYVGYVDPQILNPYSKWGCIIAYR